MGENENEEVEKQEEVEEGQKALTRTATLCSRDSTYKLKHSETSNTIMIAGLKSGDIYKQTSTFVEIDKSQTSTHQVAYIIQDYPFLNVNPKTSQYYLIEGLPMQAILDQCQISEAELETLCLGPERFNLNLIVTNSNSSIAFFQPYMLSELIDHLLVVISSNQNLNSNLLKASDLLEFHDGVINSKFLLKEGGADLMINYALHYIADFSSDLQSFKINTSKITKAIGVTFLEFKNHYLLGEYLEALNKALELALPVPESSLVDPKQESAAISSPFNVFKNLFENYKDQDLSFLKGYAILIPASELKANYRDDHVIKSLHIYYAEEFRHCLGSHEKRLEVLFTIKEKWTKGELETYLTPFIDLTLKFDTYLMKNTRMIREKNPFDPSQEVAYYVKKF